MVDESLEPQVVEGPICAVRPRFQPGKSNLAATAWLIQISGTDRLWADSELLCSQHCSDRHTDCDKDLCNGGAVSSC